MFAWLPVIRLPHIIFIIAQAMPIDCQLPIRDLSKDEFDDIDRIVMGHAFTCQNELGRLCDELVYENDLANRLRSASHDVTTQVPIEVTHRTFQKTYRLDLVCNHAVYDGKTVAALTGAHDAQILNYAMLLNIRHIKLLNFRNPKVEGRLKYNVITQEKRYRVEFVGSQWKALTEACRHLRSVAEDVVRDLGAFLTANLYEEAIAHFFGGKEQCEVRIDVARAGHKLGTHRVLKHANDLFFLVTTLTRSTQSYRQHLERLLRLTAMRGIQWINLKHHQVEFVTITSHDDEHEK